MSKYQFRESDIYLPGTDIPRNRLGVEDPNLLHEIEEALLQQAYQVFIAELEPTPVFSFPRAAWECSWGAPRRVTARSAGRLDSHGARGNQEGGA